MELNQAIDILDRFDFFQGQRAGRELWNDKPFEVQEQDIAKFSQDVASLKNYINALATQNEQWRTDWERNQAEWDRAYEKLEAENAEQDEAILNALKEMGKIRQKTKIEVLDTVCKEFSRRYEIWDDRDAMEYQYSIGLLSQIEAEMLEANNENTR